MYTPFEKAFSQVEAADLAALRTVSEGWYVEYKRKLSTAAATAKSVSAFANTYGGWLFYGIDEKSKNDAVAGAFPGLPDTEADAALQHLRQAIATQVAPSPHYEAKMLAGPCVEIGIADDRVVLCVRVPWSPNTPHVHKSGRIYRRVADGSEPKPENDRFVLDQLWKRGDEIRQHYADWIDREPEFTVAEAEGSFIRLLLVADLWNDRNLWTEVSLREVCNIMGSSDVPGISVPFETVHTSATGFVARQLKGGQPQQLGLTWWFRRDLRSEILIPLNRFEANDPSIFRFKHEGFEHAERFVEILQSQGFRNTPVIDLNFLFAILVGVMKTQDRLSTTAGWDGSLWFKAQLLNVWRTCPFIDLNIVLDEFEARGVPLSLYGHVDVLPGSTPNTFLEISSHEDIEPIEVRSLMKAFDIFHWIARALGVPPWLPVDEHGLPVAEPDTEQNFLMSLLDVANRGLEAQQRRNERQAERE